MAFSDPTLSKRRLKITLKLSYENKNVIRVSQVVQEMAELSVLIFILLFAQLCLTAAEELGNVGNQRSLTGIFNSITSKLRSNADKSSFHAVAQLSRRFSPAIQIFSCSFTVKRINF